jgi:hypothetical protein
LLLIVSTDVVDPQPVKALHRALHNRCHDLELAPRG